MLQGPVLSSTSSQMSGLCRESMGEGLESDVHVKHSTMGAMDRDFIEITSKLSQHIAQMGVTNPEVLRVTPAFRAFQQCAAALRSGCDGDFFYKSHRSRKISTFWSHSWHGGHWKKILTLIILYNGPAAIFLGFFTAILMMLLFSFELLPGYDRGFQIRMNWSTWSLSSGLSFGCFF